LFVFVCFVLECFLSFFLFHFLFSLFLLLIFLFYHRLSRITSCFSFSKFFKFWDCIYNRSGEERPNSVILQQQLIFCTFADDQKAR
jgi:hypothetical protein